VCPSACLPQELPDQEAEHEEKEKMEEEEAEHFTPAGIDEEMCEEEEEEAEDEAEHFIPAGIDEEMCEEEKEAEDEADHVTAAGIDEEMCEEEEAAEEEAEHLIPAVVDEEMCEEADEGESVIDDEVCWMCVLEAPRRCCKHQSVEGGKSTDSWKAMCDALFSDEEDQYVAQELTYDHAIPGIPIPSTGMATAAALFNAPPAPADILRGGPKKVQVAKAAAKALATKVMKGMLKKPKRVKVKRAGKAPFKRNYKKRGNLACKLEHQNDSEPLPQVLPEDMPKDMPEDTPVAPLGILPEDLPAGMLSHYDCGLPEDALPQQPRKGNKSYTVASSSGAVIEIQLANKMCLDFFFVKLSVLLVSGRLAQSCSHPVV
jgi:hypothetical protein